MKLTLKQFNALVARKPGMQERARDMARAILVDGESASEVGRLHDVSRQAAHRAAMKVARLFYEEMECPDGWEVVQLKLPPALAEQVRALEREQLERYEATREPPRRQAARG